MNDDNFRIEQVDNVTIFVPDRYEEAKWLEEVLGLEICPEHEELVEDEEDPLMVSTDSAETKIAVCKEQPEQSLETDIHRHIGFRVSGNEFLRFLDRLGKLSLPDADGQQVTRDDIIDFGFSFAIHFYDPHGNQFELTTYDYQDIAAALE
jgi:catechol 2,3-dioxygenase-like lactoylglutathione lyase family enzyme